jgi:hypothetical protein
MMFLTLITAVLAAPQVQNPNEPGLLDPVVQHLAQRPVRLPGSDQVKLPSEQINIVGRVRKKKGNKGSSSTGKKIQSNGTNGPVKDLQQSTEALKQAAEQNDAAAMMSSAVEMRDILLGRTSGRIYDGFALLRTNRGGWLLDHVGGEYKAKRLVDRGRTADGIDGRPRRIWEVRVQLLVHEDALETDTCFLIIPPTADFRDQLRIHYKIYSTTQESFSPTTLLHDIDPLGFSRLSSKGYDAAWISLFENQITEITVDQGMLGSMRGVQVWGWRAAPDRSMFLQPAWQNADGSFDPRATVMMEQMASLGLNQVGNAAPEKKLLAVADAVLNGATEFEVLAALTQTAAAPSGTFDQWIASMQHRHRLPQEALDLLAAEGIDPTQPGPHRLGPYDAVLVYANHKLYVDAQQRDLLPEDAARLPRPHSNDAQGSQLRWKVINLDATTHYLQTSDYGPALVQEMANCYQAPWGGQSLEIFVDHPLQGAPKMAELQWRLGWSLRRRLGTVPQFDVFSQAQDQLGLASYTDEWSRAQSGWQYPALDRGGDWRVQPPRDWRGGQLPQLQENGVDGVVIGTTTSGFGVAQMPVGDLSMFHPQAAVNTDTDGDGIADALLFPDWLRNPNPATGDLIPATADWEPFLFLSPHNGTAFIDAQRPELGLWADRTYAFGQPLAAGSAQTITVRRPRSQGQAVWHTDGLFRESAGAPSRTWSSEGRW